jgi:DNA-binding transcriptional MerR regulator
MSKYLNISELSKVLKLVDPKTKKPLNHILRYWEKEFKVIKPKKINNRRYYSSKQVETIKIINDLLKNKGMTLSGVKNMINFKINKLDDINVHSLKANYYKTSLKTKSKLLLEKIRKLKKYGKKNSS